MCLIRLGDLSRWRETLLVIKNRDWGPAIVYYDLAANINLGDGVACHKKSVIASLNGNLLDSVYWSYRSLATTKPPMFSEDKLRGHLQSATDRFNSECEGTYALSKSTESSDELQNNLILSCLRLHAAYFLPLGPLDRRSIEDAFLHLLKVSLNRQGFEDVVGKLLIIGLAAEYTAQNRAKGKS